VNVVPLKREPQRETIECAESLLEAVKRGEVVAFAAVSIDQADTTKYWIGNDHGAKNALQFQGALWRLLHTFSHDSWTPIVED
jgi:hypothetical protein